MTTSSISSSRSPSSTSSTSSMSSGIVSPNEVSVDFSDQKVTLIPFPDHPYAQKEDVIRTVALPCIKLRMEELTKPNACILSVADIQFINNINQKQSGKTLLKIMICGTVIIGIIGYLTNSYMNSSDANLTGNILAIIGGIFFAVLGYKFQRDAWLAPIDKSNYMNRTLIPGSRREAEAMLTAYGNNIEVLNQLKTLKTKKPITEAEIFSLEPIYFPLNSIKILENTCIEIKNLASQIILNSQELDQTLRRKKFDDSEIRALMEPIFTASHIILKGNEATGDSKLELYQFYSQVINNRMKELRRAILDYRKSKSLKQSASISSSSSRLSKNLLAQSGPPTYFNGSSSNDYSPSGSDTVTTGRKGSDEQPKRVSPPNSNKLPSTRLHRTSFNSLINGGSSKPPTAIRAVSIPGATEILNSSEEVKKTERRSSMARVSSINTSPYPKRPPSPNPKRAPSPVLIKSISTQLI